MTYSSHSDICGRVASVRLEVAGPRGKAIFAKRLGISASTYDYYESARIPPADVLVKISKVAVVQLKRQIGLTCKIYRRQGRMVHLVPIHEQFPPQVFPCGQVVWALAVLARIRPG